MKWTDDPALLRGQWGAWRLSTDQLTTVALRYASVMTEPSAVEHLIGPVVTWIATGGDAWLMNLEYWERRRQMMDAGELFDGPAAEYLSDIDTAMDAFNPSSARGWHEIDETQLRNELDAAIGSLRRLGYVP